jgi:hypothetical protein
MGIPIGKLQLCTACAAVPPGRLPPVLFDIGTFDAALRADPLYLYLREPPASAVARFQDVAAVAGRNDLGARHRFVRIDEAVAAGELNLGRREHHADLGLAVQLACDPAGNELAEGLRGLALRHSDQGDHVGAVDVGVERGDLEHAKQRAGFDRIDHDRIGLAADAIFDLGNLSGGIGLRIEHDQVLAELLGGLCAARDAALETRDLQAERDEADCLCRRDRRRQTQGDPSSPTGASQRLLVMYRTPLGTS